MLNSERVKWIAWGLLVLLIIVPQIMKGNLRGSIGSQHVSREAEPGLFWCLSVLSVGSVIALIAWTVLG